MADGCGEDFQGVVLAGDFGFKVLNVGAVLLDWALTRDNLVRAMIDGTKAVSPTEPAAPARGGSVWLAAAIAAPLAALGFYMFQATRF